MVELIGNLIYLGQWHMTHYMLWRFYHHTPFYAWAYCRFNRKIHQLIFRITLFKRHASPLKHMVYLNNILWVDKNKSEKRKFLVMAPNIPTNPFHKACFFFIEIESYWEKIHHVWGPFHDWQFYMYKGKLRCIRGQIYSSWIGNGFLVCSF
jgi:hypothetical protein